MEICVSSTTAIQHALEGGADRLEVCGSLVEGGVTPSYGLLLVACEMAAEVDRRVEVVALVRPRGGDFVYSGWCPGPVGMQAEHQGEGVKKRMRLRRDVQRPVSVPKTPVCAALL